jgi:hypothetical protein
MKLASATISTGISDDYRLYKIGSRDAVYLYSANEMKLHFILFPFASHPPKSDHAKDTFYRTQITKIDAVMSSIISPNIRLSTVFPVHTHTKL